MRKVYIFHQYGAKSHYRALQADDAIANSITLVFREFSILRLLIIGVKRMNLNVVGKQCLNLCFMFSLIFTKNRKIVVGIAPFDWRVIIYYALLRKHHYYLHTSYPYWDYSKYPKKLLAKSRLSRFFWSRFIKDAEGIFCATKAASEQISTFFSPQKTSVVAHSIPASFVSPLHKFNLSRKLKCLFVGQYGEAKGIDLLFQLIDKLPKEDFEFSFAGKGEQSSEVETFCERRSNCFNYGYLNDLLEVYNDADILLVPSVRTGDWEELLGMVIIEAMSRGVIPITTDHTGPCDIIDFGINGFYFTEDAFCDETIKLLNRIKNSRELESLRVAAYQKGQEYAPNLVIKKWNSILFNE